MIEEKKFNEIDFSKIPIDCISLEHVRGKGLKIRIFEKHNGRFITLYESFLPVNLQDAVYNYVENKINKDIWPD